MKLECCNCNRNNFKTEEECLQRCTHVNDETTSDYLSHEEKEEEGEEEARPDQGKQFKGKKRAKPQKDILPRSLTAYQTRRYAHVVTRPVESKSLNVGKSLKIEKNRIKSENLELIFY